MEIWSVPGCVEEGNTGPFTKKGKGAGDPLSYWTILLLPMMGKVLESLAHPRLKKYFLERRLIPDFQTVFKKEHSTSFNQRRLFFF